MTVLPYTYVVIFINKNWFYDVEVLMLALKTLWIELCHTEIQCITLQDCGLLKLREENGHGIL